MLHRLREELRSIALVTLYFAACFIVIMLLKQMWLAEYGIEFTGISVALVAALVTAKVMIVLDHVPLAQRLRGWPGAIEVATRSAVYTSVVLLVLVIEKAFESRAEQGGLMPALANILQHPDLPNLVATTIAIGLAFLAYTAFAIVHRDIGGQRMREIFLSRHATQL